MTPVAVTVLVALTLLGLVVVLFVGKVTAARTRGWLDGSSGSRRRSSGSGDRLLPYMGTD
jgi:hypothetical protein